MAGAAAKIAAAGLAALAVGMGIGRFAFTPVLPLMQAEGTLTLAGGGVLAAANYAGYLAGALTAPLVSSALGVRAGLAGIAFFTVSMALTEQIFIWTLLRAAAGVASAWVLVHVSAWCLQRLPASRPSLSGAVYSGVGVGSMLAGLACLLAIELQYAARYAWLVLGAISCAATLLLWPLFAQKTHGAHRATRMAWNRRSALLVLCYGAFGFGYIIPATFIPAFAREALGSAALYAWAWPVFGAAAAASTVAAAALVRRLGERAVWIAGHLVMAAGVAAPLVLPGMPGILASALCVGATFMVVTMTGLQEARKLGGAEVLAAMTAGFALGQIAGPVLVSLLAQAGARPEYASLAACLALVASAAALWSGRIFPR